MMRRAVAAALAASVLLAMPSPAGAWDPFDSDEDGWQQPPAAPPPPDPAPLIAPPPGVYYVTDTYVADVVTSEGPLTTYTTTTVHESTGSYARVLETVGTGDTSAFDGEAFNGRRTLGDGRAVAGTYYENYVLGDAGFLPVSIVFFQDDAELARAIWGPPVPPGTSPGGGEPGSSGSSAEPSTSCCPALPLEPGGTLIEPRDDRAGPPGGRTTPPDRRAPAAPIPVRPGVSLLPASPPVGSVEVLRGRPVTLWLRAFAGDREVPVRSWTLLSGESGRALATAGTGAAPFRAAWERLAPPDRAYVLRFRIEVDTRATGHAFVDMTIAVTVRSPALES